MVAYFYSYQVVAYGRVDQAGYGTVEAEKVGSKADANALALAIHEDVRSMCIREGKWGDFHKIILVALNPL